MSEGGEFVLADPGAPSKEAGEMQTQYAPKRVPSGNYVLIGGAPTDYNALILREGQMIAAPHRISNGKIGVPSILFASVAVDRSNIDTTVISNGYRKREEIDR